MFNSVEIYAHQFKPVEGGYLYYPTRWSRGYLVTESEFGHLCAEWQRVSGWPGMLKLLGMVVLITMLVPVVAEANLSDTADAIVGFGIPMAVCGYFGWKVSAAYRLVRSREPIAPKRTLRDADGDSAKNLSWPLAIVTLAVSLSFGLVLVLVALASPLVGLPLLALFAVATFVNVRIVLRKWADRPR